MDSAASGLIREAQERRQTYLSAGDTTSILDVEGYLERRSVKPKERARVSIVHSHTRKKRATHHKAVEEPSPLGLGFPASQLLIKFA